MAHAGIVIIMMVTEKRVMDDAYDGTGIGRAWPLLTGERGHYEVAAGNITGAKKLLAGDGCFCIQWFYFRTNMGYRGYTGKGIVFWKTFRLRHAAYMGACRVYKTLRFYQQ